MSTIDLPVLFEDESIVAYNKPACLLVAPDRWDKTRPNLMRFIHETISPTIFNAHRLDFETSGVLVCGKTRKSLTALCRLFETRDMAKEYLAITRGLPAETRGRIALALEKDPARPGRMCVVSDGHPAATDYEVREQWCGYALIAAQPLTGRQHQIRVHLAAIHCPIVADRLYGDGHGLLLSEFKPDFRVRPGRPERPLIGTLALHAYRLSFKHPETGADLIIEAPLPKHFEIALRNLRKYG